MEAIRFKSRIEKDRIIKVPDSVELPEAEVDVIVLVQRKAPDRYSDRWEHWIRDKVLSGGVIEEWTREEIYARQ